MNHLYLEINQTIFHHTKIYSTTNIITFFKIQFDCVKKIEVQTF
jgi:hypothetical protein